MLIESYPGTGKTLLALEIARLGIKRTSVGLGWLWIVHMNDISITQRNGDFKAFIHRTGINILYSSDGNLSDIQLEQINIQTEPFILVSSKQLILDRDKFKYLKNDKFIGIIIDECRHSTAPKYYDGIHALMQSQKNLRFIIGLDGTPFKKTMNIAYYSNNNSPIIERTISENISEIKPLTNEERNDRLCTMYIGEDNEYFSYGYQEAITDGSIVALKIIIAVIPIIDYKSISNFIENKMNEFKLPYKKGIIWSSDIKQAEEATKMIIIPGITVLKTHSGNKENKISAREQNENMDIFYNSKGNTLINTVDRLKEGSNVPLIDFGFNISNQDNIDINAKKQEIARIQRNAPNKNFALYIDFITDNYKFSKVYSRLNIYKQIYGKDLEISIEGISIDIPRIEHIINLNNNSIREIFSVKTFIANLNFKISQDFNEETLVNIYNDIRRNDKRLPALDKDKTVQGYTILEIFRSTLEKCFYNKNEWRDVIKRQTIKTTIEYYNNYKNDLKLVLNPQLIYIGFTNLSREINDVFRSTTVKL